MKNLLKKNKPVSRLIALWLVFVMMLTPLISHMGTEKGAKAAGPDEPIEFTPPAITVDLTGVSIEDKSIDGVGGGTVTEKFITELSVQNNTSSPYYFDTSALAKGVKLKKPVTTLSATQVSINSTTYDVEIVGAYLVCGDAVLDYKSKDTTSNEQIDNIADTTTVNYFVKFKLTNTSDSSVILTGYSMVAKYKLEKTDAFAADASWKDSTDIATDSDKWYNGSNIKLYGAVEEYGTNANYLGVVKYAFIKYELGKDSYAQYDFSNYSYGSWKAPDATNPLTALSEGTYIGFVGYFGSSSDTEPMKVASLGTVQIDNYNPLFDSSCKYLYYEADGDWSDFGFDDNNIISNKEIEAADISKYRYYVRFYDSESGVESVKIKQGSNPEQEMTKQTIGGVDYWYCEAKFLSASDKVYAWAYDKAGNTSKYGDGEELFGKISEFVPRYNLTWTYDGAAHTMSSNNTLYVGPEKNLILDFDCASTTKIKYIAVTADVEGGNNDWPIATVNNSDGSTSGPYTFSGTINFANKLNYATAKLSDIKVKFYDAAGNEIVAGSTDVTTPVWFDKNKPTITFTDAPEDKWYKELPEFEFTAKSGSGTKETYIDELKVVYENTEYPITDSEIDTSASVTSNFTSPAQSSSIDGSSMKVTATDMAGNVGTKECTVKVDTTKPTVGGLWISHGSLETSYTYNQSYGSIYVGNDSKLRIVVNDNFTIGKLELTYTLPSSATGTYTKTINADVDGSDKTCFVPLTEFLGDTLTEGEYNVEVAVYDKAGNKCDTTLDIDFTIDTVAPGITNVEFFKLDSSWANPESAESDTHKIVDGKFYIDADDATANYAYKVTVSEDVNYATLSTVNPSFSQYGLTVEQIDSKTFWLKVDKSKLSKTVPVDFDLIVEDKAGNTSLAKDNVPDLYAINKDVAISATICRKTGNEYTEISSEEYANLQYGTNEQYYVKVSTSSRDDVSSITLYRDNTVVVETKNTSNGWNVLTQTYTYDVYFELPTNENILFENWFAKINFANSSAVDSTPLDKLLYDKTIPVVLKTDDTAFSSDATWYNAKTIDFKMISGETAIESKISEAYVIVSNSNDDASVSQYNRVQTPVTELSDSITIPESRSVSGTKIQFAAKDIAGNELTVDAAAYTFLVDASAPTIGTINVLTDNEVRDITTPVSSKPSISFDVNDNLALSNVQLQVVYPDGVTVKTIPYSYDGTQALASGYDGISINYLYEVEAINGKVPDGQYTVYVKATDKANNPATTKVATFTVDSTLPVVTARVATGTTANKSSVTSADGDKYDYYYRSDVGVDFTYSETNKGTITVTDNGNPVAVEWKLDASGIYKGSLNFTSEGTHEVTIAGTDQAGNAAVKKTVKFYIDKTGPSVTAILNGGLVYAESMGTVKMSADTTLSASVSDVAEDAGDFNIQIVKAVPDQPVSSPDYVKTSSRSFGFADEAEYTVNLYSVDMAGNQSAIRTVKFRLDKTAPNLSISGASGGKTSSQTTVSFTMKELFWADASGKVDIYRKADDDSTEQLYKTITITPTGFETVVTETLTETGEYRFEFSASDWIGHQSETSQTIIIDRDAPELTVTAKLNNANSTEILKNKQSVDVPVYVHVNITDAFYLSKKVTMTGTRVESDGTVTNLSFGSLKQNANGTAYENIFDIDGQYSLTIVATDAAGNESTQSLSFTIDKDAPVIQDITTLWSGAMTSFEYVDVASLVSDMTDCEIHMYLNGIEYDGSEELADGAYTLLVTAEDELGHYVEMETSFVIDSQAPTFIVTGVEKDQVKDGAYEIVVSLQLETDTLVSVVLNGVEQPIVNNMCAITINEKGDYTLEITAMDEAGNISTDTYEFKYGEEFNWWIIVVIALAVILLGTVVFIVAKKRKSDR